MLADYHIHTKNSPDSEAALTRITLQAAKNGIHEIAVTEHCEANMPYSSWGRLCIDRTYGDLKALPRKSMNGVEIKFGLELGQAIQNRSFSSFMIREYEYDCILASLHNLDGQADFYFLSFTRADIPLLLKQYFIELEALVSWGRFDILAHMTYPMRYLSRLDAYYDLTAHDEAVIRILRKLITQKLALEINTSSFFKGYGKMMPDAHILTLYRELGGELLTFGSDAHEPQNVGIGFREAVNLAKSCGFTTFSTYTKREIFQHPLPSIGENTERI